MHSILFQFPVILNSVLLFWKLLVFEFLLGISETLLCSMSAPHVKTVPLLDVHQLLMLSAGTLTYSEPRTFSSIILYMLQPLTLFILLLHYIRMYVYMYVCVYEYSRRIMA
jgi:hypothetical protein